MFCPPLLCPSTQPHSDPQEVNGASSDMQRSESVAEIRLFLPTHHNTNNHVDALFFPPLAHHHLDLYSDARIHLYRKSTAHPVVCSVPSALRSFPRNQHRRQHTCTAPHQRRLPAQRKRRYPVNATKPICNRGKRNGSYRC